MNGDRLIDEVLRELGFGDAVPLAAARASLETAGLTRAGKARISETKIPRIQALLDQSFARTCADPICRSALAHLKPLASLLPVDPQACERCGGSDNRKALRRLADLCRSRGVARIVVVGGSPSVREELTALRPAEWDLRLIDGTERRTSDKARADLDWAQLVLVWGSSELDHRVSQLYTDVGSPHRHKVVHVARRGVAALLSAGAEHLERGRK